MLNKTYAKRKENGVCPLCGKDTRDENIYCNECREKEKIKQQENRSFYRNLGICPRCRKNKLFGEEKTCPECLARYAIINQKSRERTGKTQTDYYREHQRKLEEQGLCRSSCGRKRVAGHTYCQICLDKQKERARKQRMKKKMNYVGIRRSERPNYGLCYTCGKPLDRDGRTCRKCAENATSNLPVQHDNKWWREQDALIFK